MIIASDEVEKEVEKKNEKKKKKKFTGSKSIDEEAEVEDAKEGDGEDDAIKLMEIEEEKISKVFINDDHEGKEAEVDINLYGILENSRILDDETRSAEYDSICDNNKSIPDDVMIGPDDIKLLPIAVQNRIKQVTEAEDVECKQTKILDDMNLHLTEKQKDKFKANIRKELVKSGDDDGNCTFYSILNALIYKKTNLVKEIKDEDDSAVIDKIGKEVLDILKKYKSKLRYCRQSDSIKHLVSFK